VRLNQLSLGEIFGEVVQVLGEQRLSTWGWVY
jgi:hypothetical protein